MRVADGGLRASAAGTAAVVSSTVELRRGRLIRVSGLGRTVHAHSGRVWITEENSERDVVLEAGQSFRLVHPGLAIVEAFSDASISIHRG
jgi:DUF2917 family protein